MAGAHAPTLAMRRTALSTSWLLAALPASPKLKRDTESLAKARQGSSYCTTWGGWGWERVAWG